ncbi:hypothetical protein AB0M54_31450 [Actinoplanes sp. NPDC051470]|uniref:hypothetical protein n=1 Tax=Actinoplanes sp. NPDC051470 TaxID=3157224 RepID=UPI003445F2F7
MIDLGFRYLALKVNGAAAPPSSLVAYLNAEGPMQAVMWNVPNKSWEFDPGVATAFLFEEDRISQRERVDRVEAEQIAREHLDTKLPTEDQLRQICAAGLALWTQKEDLSGSFEDDDFPDGVWKPEDDEPPGQS